MLKFREIKLFFHSSSYKKILRQKNIQTVLILGVYLLISPFLPSIVHTALYTNSLLIKDLLIWIMPLTVSFFIAHTISSFGKKAPAFILSLIVFEILSNFSSIWYTFLFANFSMDLVSLSQGSTLKGNCEVFWRLPFKKPTWWSADKGCIIGLVLGCIVALNKSSIFFTFLLQGKRIIDFILTRFFSQLIPLFVLGFVAHLYQTQLLQQIFVQYAIIIVFLLIALCLYMFFLLGIATCFNPKNMVRQLRNLIPAGSVALTSGCSLSTMPWTIEGTAKNLQTPKLAEAIIPATTNFQQIGDCVANTFLCFIIYKHINGYSPPIDIWLTFSIAFVFARFATAAILGGAIFVMLPIYENYLNFTPEMIAIILAFNVILDPVITSGNVVTNGILCSIFERFWMWIERMPIILSAKNMYDVELPTISKDEI